MKALPSALAAVALLALSLEALPATNLPQVCTNPAEAGKTVLAGCGGSAQTGQIFRTPRDTDLVRVRSDGATSADWDSPAYIWRAWKDVPLGGYYDTCRSDVPEGSAVAGSSCSSYGMVPRTSAPAGEPTFTLSPTSGRAPLQVTLTWNVPEGSACQAGGAWSGSKPAQGTETLTLQQGTSALTLSCSRAVGPPATGEATLSWTLPTQYTDGKALPASELAGVIVWSGTTNPPQTQYPSVIAPATRSLVLRNLEPGTHYFQLSAQTLTGIQSDRSAVGQKTIPSTPTSVAWTGSQTATVEAPLVAKPRPPVITVE